ncbi:hypothetical protein Dimus_023575 [Dionaea muscipula]
MRGGRELGVEHDGSSASPYARPPMEFAWKVSSAIPGLGHACEKLGHAYVATAVELCMEEGCSASYLAVRPWPGDGGSTFIYGLLKIGVGVVLGSVMTRRAV